LVVAEYLFGHGIQQKEFGQEKKYKGNPLLMQIKFSSGAREFLFSKIRLNF